VIRSAGTQWIGGQVWAVTRIGHGAEGGDAPNA